MDSLAEFWKRRNTIRGVLIFNALLPGLGAIYAGGGRSVVALSPFLLMFVVSLIFGDSFITSWCIGWFWFSVIGCSIVLIKRVDIGVPAPGPNTRDLADSFGKGHGKGAAVAALDTLEQKVKKADEILKATRALELENAKKKDTVESLELPEPIAIVEERPASLAREVPHFIGDKGTFNPGEKQDSLILKAPEISSEATPTAETRLAERQFETAPSEPAMEVFKAIDSDDFVSTTGALSTGDAISASGDDSASPSISPSHNTELTTSGFDFSPQRETPDLAGAISPEPTEYSSLQSSIQSDSLSSSLEPQSDLLDFNATNSPEMGAPLATSFESTPPNDLSFSLTRSSSELQKGDNVPADAKFALEPAQTPEQIQQFFEKLGETVGTSYQQEPLSKPSFDISFPSFESPNFSFDFSSALSSDFSSMSGLNPEPDENSSNKDSCKRCGVAKHADFTFCLGCGISF